MAPSACPPPPCRHGASRGLTSRPLGPGDARAVFELMAAQELAGHRHGRDRGGRHRRRLGTAQLRHRRPRRSASSTATGWSAYGEVSRADRGDVAVHPAYRGRGIGTALARWMQETARSRGAPSSACRCRRARRATGCSAELGYRVRWTSWVLRAARRARTIEERPLPDGYAVRVATRRRPRRPRRRSRTPSSSGRSASGSLRGLRRRGVRPARASSRGSCRSSPIPTARSPARQLRRHQRGRRQAGDLHLAGSPYAGTSATAASRRRCWSTRSRRPRARRVGSCLSTDSRTGALGLYEKVGMGSRRSGSTARMWTLLSVGGSAGRGHHGRGRARAAAAAAQEEEPDPQPDQDQRQVGGHRDRAEHDQQHQQRHRRPRRARAGGRRRAARGRGREGVRRLRPAGAPGRSAKTGSSSARVRAAQIRSSRSEYSSWSSRPAA